METKELSDDVLRIIRAYSIPAFVHFREYNQALKLFSLSLDYKKKLKKNIDSPDVSEQIQICVKAEADYQTKNAEYHAIKTSANEHIKDKAHYWKSVFKEKFMVLLDKKEYHIPGRIGTLGRTDSIHPRWPGGFPMNSNVTKKLNKNLTGTQILNPSQLFK